MLRVAGTMEGVGTHVGSGEEDDVAGFDSILDRLSAGSPSGRSAGSHVVVEVDQPKGIGSLGNRLFEVMAGIAIAEGVGGAQIQGVEIPPMSLISAAIPVNRSESRTMRLSGRHALALSTYRLLVESGQADRLITNLLGMRVEYFGPQLNAWRAHLDKVLTPPRDVPSPQSLVINIRADEVLKARHPDYFPLPINFYRTVLERTGLAPVVMGQVQPSRYMDELLRRIPESEVLELEPIDAFQYLRLAPNKVLSISSFSWLAAWMGSQEATIHMPLAGFLNPVRRPDVDLWPSSDERFVGYWFAPLGRSRRMGLRKHLGLLDRESKGYPVIGGQGC